MKQIPPNEHHNLHYFIAHTDDKGEFVVQDTLVFDLDKIDMLKTQEYIPVVCDFLGIDQSKTGILMSGHGLHFVILLDSTFHIFHEERLDGAKKGYKFKGDSHYCSSSFDICFIVCLDS